MDVLALVFLAAWVLFWIYWIVASVGVKAPQARWGRFAGIRVVVVLIALLLIRVRAFKGQAVTNSLWLEVIGLVMFLAGLALALWARRRLGRNWGSPMSQKVNPELVTTGPYRWVRHPIYSGLILAMGGTAMALTWYWLVAVAVLGTYFIHSARMEERYMRQRFPDAYPEYQRATKMLIPFVL